MSSIDIIKTIRHTEVDEILRLKMPKKSANQRLEGFSNFKFDASKYVILDTKVRRDAASGRLVMKGAADSNAGKNKK